jgi:hypothetical protein
MWQIIRHTVIFTWEASLRKLVNVKAVIFFFLPMENHQQQQSAYDNFEDVLPENIDRFAKNLNIYRKNN